LTSTWKIVSFKHIKINEWIIAIRIILITAEAMKILKKKIVVFKNHFYFGSIDFDNLLGVGTPKKPGCPIYGKNGAFRLT
jgi:hypothetical protein